MKKSNSIRITALFLALMVLGCPVIAQNPAEITNLTPLQKICINEMIRLDDSLGTIRNNACEQVSLSRSIRNYVRGIGALNFRNCPPRF